MFKITAATLAISTLTASPRKSRYPAGLLFILAFFRLFFTPRNLTYAPNRFIRLDTLRTTLIALTLWISGLMIIARQKITLNNLNPAIFINYIIILATTLILAFSVSNSLIFYILFEASLIPTFLLVVGWGYQPERIQARSYLLIYTVTASLPLLLSITLIEKCNSSLYILFILRAPLSGGWALSIWWVTIVMAFLVKVPIYTTHLWLPKAHVEAPVAGSIILAAILLKLGGYGLIRFSYIIPHINQTVKSPLICLALIGGIYRRIICLRQTDLKALIAYSSVGHISPLIAGIFCNSDWAWQGALIIMAAHGFTSSALFAIANITYESTQTRRVHLTKGLLIVSPAISLLWFTLCTSNIAGPPSINLLGEISLIGAILPASLWLSMPLGLLVFLGGAYSLHLYTSVNHGKYPRFSNPSALFNPRNLLILILHIIPIFILFTKIDLFILLT